MGARDSRVTAYIENSPPYAQPILEYLRDLVHETCPEVEEDLKWRVPAFIYQGILAGMAAFKERAMFGFWKGSLLSGNDGGAGGMGMGEMGDLTSISDLPPKRVLVSKIRQAMKLNEDGIKVPKKSGRRKPAAAVPADLKNALAKNRKAGGAFEKFSPSHRREYVEWITEAKSEDTRNRRLDQAIEWIAEGKPRNWKYMKR